MKNTMKPVRMVAAAVALAIASGIANAGVQQSYTPTPESLVNYEVPEWYQDAKFGVWAHWGVYSVPEYRGWHAAEWYPRHMYSRKDNENNFFKYHSERYGDPAEFGYKDLIPHFTAEKFNPDEWMDLAVDAGAKFYTVVSIHHDGFAMFDSKHTRWNAVDMGPKRDITGELLSAARERGLKTGISNHFAFNLDYYKMNHQEGGDVTPETYDLYGHGKGVDEWYLKRWWDITTELVDTYQPDLYYFDWGWNKWPEFEQPRKDFLAYYYNKSIEFGKGSFGQPGVVMTYKNRHKLPLGSAVVDMERGRFNSIQPMTWQADTSVSMHSWGFANNDQYWPTNELVDMLVDIVSKNGVVMLNFGPRGDGSISEEYVTRLREMGDWLKQNGEAIYNTRPFHLYGEGPTIATAENQRELNHKGYNYTAEDIRFTRSKDWKTVYAIALDWPGDNQVLTITSLKKGAFDLSALTSITMPGVEGELSYEQTERGLEVTMPNHKPTEHAHPIALHFAQSVEQAQVK